MRYRRFTLYHTIEITLKCEECIFYELLDTGFFHFVRDDKGKIKHGFLELSQGAELEKVGINHLSVRMVKTQSNTGAFSFTFLVMQFNPAKLLGMPLYSICTGEETDAIYNAFSDVVPGLFGGIKHPLSGDLDRWRLSRIDYAYNLNLYELGVPRCTVATTLYTDLLKKGKRPPGHLPPYNGKGSIYSGKRSKSGGIISTLNIYSKLNQAWDYLTKFPFEACERLNNSQNILRCEVQCHNKKMNNYSRSNKARLPDRTLRTWASCETAEKIVLGAVAQFEIDATYRTYSEAIKRIESSDIHSNRKIRLKEIVKGTSKSKGNLQRWKAENPARFRRDMEWFTANDTNPVTIPARYEIQALPSVTSLLKRTIGKQ